MGEPEDTKALAEKARNDKIIENMKSAGLRGQIDLHPSLPDVKQLSFDDVHINDKRQHGVTEEEAKSYIKNARFSVTKWNGKYTNYFSDAGAAYVDNEEGKIRTAFKKEQYDETTRKAMEEMEK